MRLATVLYHGESRVARLDQAATVLPFSDVGALLASGPDWAGSARAAQGPEVPVEDLTYLTLVPNPEKIICAGLNYASHIQETNRTPPPHPFFFAKFSRSLIGPFDPIVLPSVSTSIDWEAELVTVIGRPTRHVDEAHALDSVAGYTIMNDITVRDWQRHGPTWLAGKTFEHSTPVGPVLLTADELPPGPPDLAIDCEVDGVRMQSGRTSDLHFGVAELIAYLSSVITLMPGDLIATGTPGGVGGARTPPVYLHAGQVVTTTIERIGRLSNPCVPETPRHSPGTTQ